MIQAQELQGGKLEFTVQLENANSGVCKRMACQVMNGNLQNDTMSRVMLEGEWTIKTVTINAQYPSLWSLVCSEPNAAGCDRSSKKGLGKTK
jgi:hypothetical protein